MVKGKGATGQPWGSDPLITGARKTRTRGLSGAGPSPVGHAGLGQTWWALTDPAQPNQGPRGAGKGSAGGSLAQLGPWLLMQKGKGADSTRLRSSKWCPDGALISSGKGNPEEGSALYLTDWKLHFSPYHLKVDLFLVLKLPFLDPHAYRSDGGYQSDGVVFSLKIEA